MDSSPHAGRARHRSASRARTPKAVRICDGVTEGVLYAMVVFAPWAFGTTERWSIWTMNVGGYILGVLLAAKWWIRWRTGNRPMRWGEAGGEETPGAEGEPQTAGIKKRSRRGLATIALAVLTVMVLAYCFTSAVNARSTFIYRQMAFAAHDYVPWLPHSYDSWATRQAFWMYLALALSFWASRDWLLGKKYYCLATDLHRPVHWQQRASGLDEVRELSPKLLGKLLSETPRKIVEASA